MSNPDIPNSVGKLFAECTLETVDLREKLAAAEARNSVLEDALRECPAIASRFSMKPDRRLHPDIAWEEMNEICQMAAHSASQQIAIEIGDHVRAALKRSAAKEER